MADLTAVRNYNISPFIASNDSPDLGSPATWPIGLPMDQQNTLPPAGLESTIASVQDPPPISTAAKVWNTIKQDSQSAGTWVESEIGSIYDGSKNVVSQVYGDVSKGVGAVASDVTSPLRSTYMYLILGIIVIAGAIYFIGKGGAVKANVIV